MKLKTQLLISKDLNLVSEETLELLISELIEITKMMSKFRSTLR